MRRQYLAMLSSVVMVFTAAGCRHTTGPIAGGPVPPGQLVPVNPGQTPILGPFGGTTRVTPPPTGSYPAVNGYLGASANPVGQPSLGFAQPGSPSQNGVTNAGVQVAGWAETGAAAQVGEPAGVESSYGTNPSAGDPRSGGMQVIDLTGAPPPPGYRPLGYQPSGYQPTAAANGYGSANPIPFAPAPNQSFAPVVTQLPSASAAQVPASQLGPSTEPIPSSAGSNDLMWRRPGVSSENS